MLTRLKRNDVDWTYFEDIDPPVDKEILIYYENGPLDKGYVVAVKNSGFGYRLPTDKTYVFIKWCLIQ